MSTLVLLRGKAVSKDTTGYKGNKSLYMNAPCGSVSYCQNVAIVHMGIGNEDNAGRVLLIQWNIIQPQNAMQYHYMLQYCVDNIIPRKKKTVTKDHLFNDSIYMKHKNRKTHIVRI